MNHEFSVGQVANIVPALGGASVVGVAPSGRVFLMSPPACGLIVSCVGTKALVLLTKKQQNFASLDFKSGGTSTRCTPTVAVDTTCTSSRTVAPPS